MSRWPRKPTNDVAEPWGKKSKKAKAKYMESLGGLYAVSPASDAAICPGESQELTPKVKKPRGRPKKQPTAEDEAKNEAKRKRKINHTLTERFEQEQVVVHCDKAGYPYFAIPNASRRTFWEAMVAKRGGMKAGVPDMCFPVPMQGYGGMYIEMKRKEGGVVSPIQKYWMALLKENNFRMELAHGASEAIPMIEDYFTGWKGLSDDTKFLLQKANSLKGDRK